MYCLLQMYMPIAERLKPQRPLLKLIAVKSVGTCMPLLQPDVDLTHLICPLVFLTFWQATFLGWLADFGVVKDVRTSLEKICVLL